MSDPAPSLSTGLFKGLDPAEAGGILGAGERLSFPAGEAIFEQGDQATRCSSSLRVRPASMSAVGSTRSSPATSSARWRCSRRVLAWRPSRWSPTSRRSASRRGLPAVPARASGGRAVDDEAARDSPPRGGAADRRLDGLSSAVEHDAARRDRRRDVRLGDLVRRARERIAVEHREVGSLALRDRTRVVVVVHVGGTTGERRDRLGERDPLGRRRAPARRDRRRPPAA